MKVKEVSIKECVYCHKIFKTYDNSIKYCSSSCKQQKKNEKRNEEWINKEIKEKHKTKCGLSLKIDQSRLHKKNGWMKKFNAVRG